MKHTALTRIKSSRTMTLCVLGAIAVAAAGGLGACNTVEGAGKDVSAAGHGISKAADDTGKAISGEK